MSRSYHRDPYENQSRKASALTHRGFVDQNMSPEWDCGLHHEDLSSVLWEMLLPGLDEKGLSDRD